MDENIEALSLLKLFQTSGTTAAQLEAFEKRAGYLEQDGLIKMQQGGVWHSIKSITPDGRMLLERLENNRWQNKWSERAIGAVFTGFTGLLVAAMVYFLNLDGNSSGVVK